MKKLIKLGSAFFAFIYMAVSAAIAGPSDIKITSPGKLTGNTIPKNGVETDTKLTGQTLPGQAVQQQNVKLNPGLGASAGAEKPTGKGNSKEVDMSWG